MHESNELPLLTSVAVVCRQFLPLSAQLQVVRHIEEFVDYSTQYAFYEACYTSIELAKRVFIRTGCDEDEIVDILVRATRAGDLDEVKLFREVGERFAGVPSSDLLNRQPFLPLNAAAVNGHLRVAKWLVKNGARLGERDHDGQTALHKAASGGHFPVLLWLVEEKRVRNLDDKDFNGATALHHAAWAGHCSIVKWLLLNGADMNETDAEGCVALHEAARGGSLEVVKLLVEKGSLINYADTNRQTVLHIAATCGYREVAGFLVEKGAHPLAVDNFGRSATYYALTNHNFVIAESILKLCSSDNTASSESDLGEILLVAASADQVGIIELLHEKMGVDIGSSLLNGRTALHEAAKGGAIHSVELLLSRGLDVCQADGFGSTALIEACRQGHLHILKHVLTLRVNLSDVDFAGRTPLHYAAEGGYGPVAELLLSHKADVNCGDKRDWTPIHCAAAAGHLEVVELLVSRGATIDIKTSSGLTALTLAIERGHPSVVQALTDPIAANTSFQIHDSTLDDFAEYFLHPMDVSFESSKYEAQVKGLWLDSPIEVKTKKSWSTNFVEELSRWSSLNHPHVVKLYGVCHGSDIEEPYFVFERAIQGSLFEYMEKLGQSTTRAELWTKLYEAALGLQYLHDRNIVHCDFSCDSIVVAENGVAKLRNLGRENDTEGFYLGCKAPEVISGLPHSLESDVYAFGMAIITAVKRSWDLWGIRGMTREKAILSGQMPEKPAEMTAVQYDLVQRMCSYNPRDRPSASDVVRELEVFTQENGAEMGESQFLSSTDALQLDETLVVSLLTKIYELREASAALDFMIQDVYERLVDVFDQLKEIPEWSTSGLGHRFVHLAQQFNSRLKRIRDMESKKSVRYAASLQGCDDIFSMHNELNVFMDAGGLSVSNEVQDWRAKWKSHRQQHQDEMLDNLSALLEDEDSGDYQQSGTSSYLSYELSKLVVSSRSSSVEECSRVKSMAAMFPSLATASWFIPAYEVEFDHFNEFNHGAFGKVYHGKWMRSQVVVKKVKLRHAKDQIAFLNEVEIWHKLYHPHVVQLFGACHVDQPFFVCEYAGGGQLDDYLRKYPEEVWTKLHEAALGLRYLHVKRVVHSDLKCNNILIGSDGRAKLTDFGLSTLETEAVINEPESEEKSDEKPNVGAIRWKAPEILRGEKATFASDVYSFGMCILEAVSGKYPWGMVYSLRMISRDLYVRTGLPPMNEGTSFTPQQPVYRVGFRLRSFSGSRSHVG